ncbi:hypothetical protein, conserved [Leishmania tarentolae]|uniref:Uncharacterized protein n=1 Tax=Leishmania tarentolae TaxID=5689 RepID=A0A640KIV4_LEITA|nr:hypothetical protein, conserved [Leishmania tarentolae]
MSDSDDDVVIIDSSSPSTPASSRRHGFGGGLLDLNESNDDVDARVMHTTSGAAAPLSSSAGTTEVSAPLQSVGAVDAVCHELEAKITSLPPLRVEAHTQTHPVDGVGGADFDSASSLHRGLLDMEAALGIRAPQLPSATASTAPTAVKALVKSWREAAGMWKRLRVDDKTREDTESDAMKRVKLEGGDEREVWHRVSDTSPAALGDIPEWAVGLEAVLERCRDLIESPNFSVAILQQEKGSSLRAALSVPPAVKPFPAPVQTQPVSSAPEAVEPVEAVDSHAALLREAELICSRECTNTLLPLYAELHSLRRMRAEREQYAAHKVEEQLEWEQLRLADMLAECDAQLEMLNSNFLDACKSRLVPLEMLQQRLDALHKFHRQLETHAAAMLPFPVKGGKKVSKNALVDPELVDHAPRPMGLVGDALSQRMSEERLAWRKKVDTLQARLDEQKKKNAKLQACYIQTNLELQASLERDHYVNKGVLNALKAQSRADMEAVVEKLGWTLLHNTVDVLSLRHPGSGATLHVNHAYSTINGQACEDVVKALAAYILKHSDSTVSTLAHAATAPVSVCEAVNEGLTSEGHCGRTALHPPIPSSRTSSLQSEAESADGATRKEASEGGGRTVLTATKDVVAQAESASPSFSTQDQPVSAPSSSGSVPPSDAEGAAAEEPLMHVGSASLDHEVVRALPQSPIYSETAAGSTGEEAYKENDAYKEHAGAEASSNATGEGEDDGEDITADVEGDSTADEKSYHDEGATDTDQEELAGYSNLQTEDGSVNTSTLNESIKPPSSGSKGCDPQTTPEQPSPYESFFSSNQLWESEDE